MSSYYKRSRVVGKGVSIEPLIHYVRGQKVILDSDLARVYGVTTKRLNEQVKRNKQRFPSDFMFRLTSAECTSLMRSQNATGSSRSQFATLKRGQNIKYLPYVFTEHGAVMAANVLNSPSAVRMSIFVVRAFMRMRVVLSGHKELMKELKALEKKLTGRLDVHEVAIVDVLKRMLDLFSPSPMPPAPPKPRIGFHM